MEAFKWTTIFAVIPALQLFFDLLGGGSFARPALYRALADVVAMM